jgi:hypothetical protein
MSKKFHVQARTFLNKTPGMRAYVIGVVEDTRDIPDCYEDGWKWGQIELKMADCYEEISLEFNMSTREDRENSLHKIRRLAEVITAVRDAIEIEAESIEAREAIKPLLRALTAVH